MRLLLATLLSVTLLTAPLVRAQEVTSPAAPTVQAPERGWFFFDDPKPVPPAKEPEPVKPPMLTMPTEPPPPPKEQRCTKKDTWSPECGFVNPGTDFAFQAKQRDALMERMSVAQNDPKAVEAFQYYMRWVLERTSEVSNLWWYNMVQNPELDPTVKAPISAFGLRLMTDVQKGRASEIFKLIKEEGGFLVYFTRTDCDFCHKMAPVMLRLAKDTGLEIRDASLDNRCIEGLEEGCVTAPKSLGPAQALQVATVPSVFLYVKPNTWLRIATGVVDEESMQTRVVQFFSAYRAALLRGTDNSSKGRPSVDFSNLDATGVVQGVPGADASKPTRQPSQSEVNALLGVPASK